MQTNTRRSQTNFLIPTMVLISGLVFFVLQVSRKPLKMVSDTETIIKEKKESGNRYFKNKEYDQALKKYEEVVSYITSQLSIDFYNLESETSAKHKQSLRHDLAIIFYNISLVHFEKGDYYEAINNLKESMIYEELNHAKNKMAACYFKIGEFYKALDMVTALTVRSKEISAIMYKLECNKFLYRFPAQIDQRIDVEYCKKVMNTFLQNKRIKEEELINILRIGYNLHLNIENVQFVNSSYAIIFGDTHGQFLDTCNIMTELGNNVCSNFTLDNKKYIFNGDFVDRGKDGIENFVFLLLLKILYPQQIYLNRGNHEYENINRQFGFFEELKLKYTNAPDLFQAFQLAFSSLPLCAVLNNKYFIVHGGLPEKTLTIRDIQNLDRFQTVINNKSIEGLMWSDPGEIQKIRISKRGAGIVFGYEITNAFLELNGFEKIIRSHEYVPDGIHYNHDNKVITIFSAPNYCNIEGDASVLRIEHGELKVIKVRFWKYNTVFRKNIENLRN